MTDKVPEIDILVKTHKGQKSYHFSQAEIIVGRSKTTTLYIPLEGMSRKHFKVISASQGFAIVDLGSANGTLLNSTPLVKDKPTLLSKGDLIEIGGVQVSFLIEYIIEEEEPEILITEEMLAEEEEESFSAEDVSVSFSELKVLRKENVEKTLMNNSSRDINNLEKIKIGNIDDKAEEDQSAFLQEKNDLKTYEEREKSHEEEIENLAIEFEFTNADEINKISQAEDDVIEVNELNTSYVTEKAEVLKPVKEYTNISEMKAIKEKYPDQKLEEIKIQFERTKQIEVNKFKEELEESKKQEIQEISRLTKNKEIELQIMTGEFDNTKKVELEKIKFLEEEKKRELEKVRCEKEKLESLVKEERNHIKKIEENKREELNEMQAYAMSEIEKECLEYKEKLLEEARYGAEKEKRKILDDAELEKSSFLKNSKRALSEAKDEAEIILLHVEKEARKRKDKNYEDILESQRHNNEELIKLRRLAEEDANSYYSTIKNEATQILELAKSEVEEMKVNTNKELEYIKESANEAANIAFTEAERVRAESSQLNKNAKIQSDKILKNAYATAMLIKNTNQEKFKVQDEQDFFEELKEEFPGFEDQHQNQVQNIFSLINKTSEEMDDVLKEKQQIYEEENKHLRESELKRIQIEAREDAVKIKALAESEAEEIIRNAYLHSKMIETEASTRINDKQNELDELCAISNNEITERSLELKSMAEKSEEIKQHVVELTEERSTLKKKLEEEKGRFDEFFNDSSEKETSYRKVNHDLEIENQNWQNRHDKVKENFDIFEKRTDKKKEELNQRISSLNTDKEKLLVIINPLRDEVETLREEKDDLYQDNSHFFENLKTRKFEYDKLKDINDNLEESVSKNKELVSEMNSLIIEKKEEVGNLDFQIKNISSELKIKRDEIQREKESILHEAKVEEQNLKEELAHIKANKQAYAEKEIAQLKKDAIITRDNTILDGEKQRADLINEGSLEVSRLKSDTNNWITEVQAIIEEKNAEMETAEEEGKKILIERKIEAERDYNKLIVDANNLIKKSEEESNKKILLVGEKFQQKMKERENLFNTEKKDFFESAEKKRVEVINNANQKAAEYVNKAEIKGNVILSEIKKKEDAILQQKDAVLADIEKESNLLKEKLDLKFVERKKMADREISQMKIKAFELLKIERKEVEEKIENRKKIYVADITENVGIQLQLKMKMLGTQMAETNFEKLKSEISSIVDAAVFPDKDTEKKTKKTLMGTGRLAGGVKRFYLKIAIGVLTLITLFIVMAIFPQLLPGIKDVFISSIKTKESASDIFLQKEIDKKRNKPHFQPKYILGFKETYVDNVIYTKKYAETVVDPKYISKWTISLNSYLVDELGLNDNIIVKIISYENNMLRQLVELKSKINPKHSFKGIERMREKEQEFSPKIRELFKIKKDYIFFNNFKRSFFSDYVKGPRIKKNNI